MVVEINQNACLNQIDTSSFLEFKISEFEISRVDCNIIQVIGENNVSVPTHLFKIIITEDRYGRSVAAFVVPNEYIGYEHNLKEYQVGVEEIEKLVGVKFIPKVDRKALKDLCEKDGCKLMERNEFELYFIGRKLESANTMHRLEKVWAELEEKKLKPDKYLKNLYAERKQTISTFEKAKKEL